MNLLFLSAVCANNLMGSLPYTIFHIYDPYLCIYHIYDRTYGEADTLSFDWK